MHFPVAYHINAGLFRGAAAVDSALWVTIVVISTVHLWKGSSPGVHVSHVIGGRGSEGLTVSERGLSEAHL